MRSRKAVKASLPGTSPDNDSWLDRKSRLTERLGHSSYYLRNLAAGRGTTAEEMYQLDPAHYAASGGAVPVIVSGTGMVGSITVSGLDQKDDHHFAVDTVRQFLAQPR